MEPAHRNLSSHRRHSGVGEEGIDVWTSAAGPGRSRLLRTIRNGGRIGEGLSAWAIWSVVEQAAKQIGIERIGAHDPSPLICAAGTAALGL
jgi:hypothetical protein